MPIAWSHCTTFSSSSCPRLKRRSTRPGNFVLPGSQARGGAHTARLPEMGQYVRAAHSALPRKRRLFFDCIGSMISMITPKGKNKAVPPPPCTYYLRRDYFLAHGELSLMRLAVPLSLTICSRRWHYTAVDRLVRRDGVARLVSVFLGVYLDLDLYRAADKLIGVAQGGDTARGP